MVLYIIGAFMCFWVTIGPGMVALSLITPASEGRKAILVPLYSIWLSLPPLVFFTFNAMNGIHSLAMVAVSISVIAIGSVRIFCVLVIQDKTEKADKAFEMDLDLFSLRIK